MLVVPSLVLLSTVGLVGCHRADAPLGPPDSYLVYEPDPGSKPAPGSTLPGFRKVPLDDARAVPIHRVALDGFVREMLRTDYLAKQLIRDGWQGHMFSAKARARAAAEPTVLLLQGNRMARADEAKIDVGFTIPGSFGRIEAHPDVMWIEMGDDPVSDPAFVQTASGRIARLVAERLAGAGDSAGAVPRALIDGYALAMEVIGREWRVGEGPRGVLPPEAGTGTQRERFAAIRQNAFVFAPGDPHTLRAGAEMLTEPGVIAAVVYRMAQDKGIGRRVAPPEIYAPFVSARVPPGISPAAVLGPVRNFQAKLLWAWGRALLTGHPPRDLVDLVTAYADAMPAERSEVLRIFVVTTYGATVKGAENGVVRRPGADDAAASFAEQCDGAGGQVSRGAGRTVAAGALSID